jgi:hypothetical protein
MSQIASIQTSAQIAACLHARSGAFVLPAAHALSLRPKAASSLRVTCGTAWITLGDGVDHFLVPEQTLRVSAGSQVVMESVQRGAVVKFDWQPAAVEAASRERSAVRGGSGALVAEAGLTPSPTAQALLDLRGAAVLTARGLTGLATALATGLARGLGAGFAALARSAHSNASRAQGRMASCESMASSGAV